MQKIPERSKFLDLSDYFRPLSTRLMPYLSPIQAITPMRCTTLFFLFGMLSAYFISIQRPVLACVFLTLKILFDTIDGQLARERNTPSHVGRFYDSNCDFIINGLLFLTIGTQIQQIPLALAAWLSMQLQGTGYNYYYSIYKKQVNGDLTSRVDESQCPEPFSYENKTHLKIMHTLYCANYLWQDKLLHKLDPHAMYSLLEKKFMTLISIMGLGFQLALVAIALLTHQATLLFMGFTFYANAFLLIIIIYRKIQVRQNQPR